MNNENKKNYYFKIHEVIIMVVAACFLSFFAGSTIMELKMNRSKDNNEIKYSKDKYLNKFIENYIFVVENYYKDVDKDKIINGAIEGMMSTLDDPYTVYMDDDEYDNFNIVLNGSYNGIGIEMAEGNDGNIYVIGVINNSPAAKAGLKAGDIIVSIDDIKIVDYKTKDLSNYIANSKNKEFKVKIIRDNEEKEFFVGKDEVKLKSVISETFERHGHNIGYIYISIFASNTANQFAEELDKLEKSGIDSLIIDVRSNNGGHLSTAEVISSLFVDKTHIIYKIRKNNKTIAYKSKGNITINYPIVVLVNQKSASASELLTGCLKDNLNATVIGKKTYGKGTVQEVIDLSNGDQYKITTKEWLTPNGTSINGKGIAPDVEVDLSNEYFSNPSDETDNQLQTAIDYLAK